MVEKLIVYPKNMQKNLDRLGGLVHSQRVLLALTQKGVAREDAYRLVQRNAMKVWDGKGDFLTLLKADKDVRKHLSEEELSKPISISIIISLTSIRFSAACSATPKAAFISSIFSFCFSLARIDCRCPAFCFAQLLSRRTSATTKERIMSRLVRKPKVPEADQQIAGLDSHVSVARIGRMQSAADPATTTWSGWSNTFRPK